MGTMVYSLLWAMPSTVTSFEHGVYQPGVRSSDEGWGRQGSGDAGSLLDTILHFCYNKTLMEIENDHFSCSPNRGTRLGFRIEGFSV